AAPAAAGPAPEAATPAPQAPASGEAGERANALDGLFARLKETTDSDEGEGIARRIEAQWRRSGSAVADLLASRAMAASLAGDPALGVHLADQVIAFRPGWAAAWRQRATLLAQLGDDQRAAADLARALALEPRDYQALALLGALFQRNDDPAGALRAWRRSLEINPHQGELKERVEKLAPEVDGRDL
ncbi:hypothetical protein ACFOEX_12885, partial [Camelimonas abortus]